MTEDPEDPEVLEAVRHGMMVARHARIRPSAPALIDAGRVTTFADLNARANQVARLLRASGVMPGERVAVILRNGPEFVEILLGTMRAGLCLVPVNPSLTQDEQNYILADSGARAIFSHEQTSPRAAHVLHVDVERDYGSALRAHPPDDITDPQLGNRMLYTSGTTGKPKGVFCAEPPADAPHWGDGEDTSCFEPGVDRNLITGPLFHASPLDDLSLALASGAACVLMRQWDTEEALRLIAEHRVSHTHMVPTMFHRLLALPESVRQRYDVSSLKCIVHGAAPCSADVKRAMMAWVGPILWEYYAATEGDAGFWASPEDWLARPGTVGRAEQPDSCRILDDAGELLPSGAVGQVYLRTSRPFHYHNDPDKTGRAYRGDFFTVGDLGYLDDDGFLFLVGRTSEVIISGGVNVYPAEVDEVLGEHPDVVQCCTVGVHDDEWGERVVASVVTRADMLADGDDAQRLMAWCRTRLAPYKCPRAIYFVTHLPHTPSGKVRRDAVRAQLQVPGPV